MSRQRGNLTELSCTSVSRYATEACPEKSLEAFLQVQDDFILLSNLLQLQRAQKIVNELCL